jgi:hypothetical protein
VGATPWQAALTQTNNGRMGFFDDVPIPEPARPHRHHPWEPPEAEFPGIVPIDILLLARTDQVAVAVTGLSAYSAGIEIFLTAWSDKVKPNRSIPPSTVIPALVYPDVRQAVAWLSATFGFAERTRIGEGHRAQMSIGAGEVGYEVAGRGAVPVPFTWWGVDGVTGPDLDDLPGARLDQPDPLGYVQGLPERVRMPGVAGAGGEAHHVDPYPGWFLPGRDDVVPGIPGERLRRSLGSRL